jgi:chromate transporter
MSAAQEQKTINAPGFSELIWTFFKIGCLSFGGAAGQIAMMHTIVVDEKKWLDETRFQHALSACMLLPGPEAQQLATYIGWLTHGVRGGLAAGLLFIIPGALIMLAISMLYVAAANLAVVEGLFLGIKAAVLVIITLAVMKIAKRGLRSRVLIGLAILAFVTIALFDLPFPFVILAAAAIGVTLALTRPDLVGLSTEPVPAAPLQPGAAQGALIAAGWCLAAWWTPVALAALMLGPQHVVVDIGLFFSKLAVLTFGGAYALLAWLAQSAVDAGWVSAREMIDGLGLAETTPGPTILVNQFVAFLGGARAPGPLSSTASAILAAGMATWVTFAPSFLWIFAGAPFMERMRSDLRVAGALAGISAAVVGVVAAVGVWFGLHVLFRDVGETHIGVIRLITVTLSSIDLPSAVLGAIAVFLGFGLKQGVVRLVLVLGALGIAWRLVAG